MEGRMSNLIPIAIFFAGLFGGLGLGLFFAGIGLLWWVSAYVRIHLGKDV